MATAASGREEEAADHFEAAIRQARELAASTELAEASYWYARCLLERGRAEDRGRARNLVAEATQVWEEAGMPRQLERARSLEEMAQDG